MLQQLRTRWPFRRRKPLNELLAVEFDDLGASVKVLQELNEGWNQQFAWKNVRRVCFKDGGLMASDIIYVSLKEPDRVVVVPTEATGGVAFFGALVERGLFPDKAWRRAMGNTSGGMHCWPEN